MPKSAKHHEKFLAYLGSQDGLVIYNGRAPRSPWEQISDPQEFIAAATKYFADGGKVYFRTAQDYNGWSEATRVNNFEILVDKILNADAFGALIVNIEFLKAVFYCEGTRIKLFRFIANMPNAQVSERLKEYLPREKLALLCQSQYFFDLCNLLQSKGALAERFQDCFVPMAMGYYPQGEQRRYVDRDDDNSHIKRLAIFIKQLSLHEAIREISETDAATILGYAVHDSPEMLSFYLETLAGDATQKLEILAKGIFLYSNNEVTKSAVSNFLNFLPPSIQADGLSWPDRIAGALKHLKSDYAKKLALTTLTLAPEHLEKITRYLPDDTWQTVLSDCQTNAARLAALLQGMTTADGSEDSQSTKHANLIFIARHVELPVLLQCLVQARSDQSLTQQQLKNMLTWLTSTEQDDRPTEQVNDLLTKNFTDTRNNYDPTANCRAVIYLQRDNAANPLDLLTTPYTPLERQVRARDLLAGACSREGQRFKHNMRNTGHQFSMLHQSKDPSSEYLTNEDYVITGTTTVLIVPTMLTSAVFKLGKSGCRLFGKSVIAKARASAQHCELDAVEIANAVAFYKQCLMQPQGLENSSPSLSKFTTCIRNAMITSNSTYQPKITSSDESRLLHLAWMFKGQLVPMKALHFYREFFVGTPLEGFYQSRLEHLQTNDFENRSSSYLDDDMISLADYELGLLTLGLLQKNENFGKKFYNFFMKGLITAYKQQAPNVEATPAAADITRPNQV